MTTKIIRSKTAGDINSMHSLKISCKFYLVYTADWVLSTGRMNKKKGAFLCRMTNEWRIANGEWRFLIVDWRENVRSFERLNPSLLSGQAVGTSERLNVGNRRGTGDGRMGDARYKMQDRR